jgi:hypothetical protein
MIPTNIQRRLCKFHTLYIQAARFMPSVLEKAINKQGVLQTQYFHYT